MIEDKAKTAADFKRATHQGTVPTVNTRLKLDRDIVDWLKATYPKDWQREVNALIRFYMDTDLMRQDTIQPDAWEPGEMQPDSEVLASPAGP